MKTKLLFIPIILGLLGSCAKKEENFTLQGELTGMRKGTIYLDREIDGKITAVDSVFLMGEQHFEFNGFIESPEVFYLRTSKRDAASIPVFIEKGNILVNADVNDFNGAEISGSENQLLLEEFNKILGQFNLKNSEFYIEGMRAKAENDQEKMEELANSYEKNETKRIMFMLNYAVSNAAKDISPYIALNHLSTNDITVLDTINNSLSEVIKSGTYGKELNELVTQIKATEVGNKCPEIVQKDSSDNDIRLENKEGYLLLNFWASYDQNSRETQKQAEELANIFDQGQLKIISVSIDTDKKKWLNAVSQDELPWTQVSDLKGSKNQAVKKLAVRVISENVLIDKNGIIVGRNLDVKDIINILGREKS